ncbi:hypothetical protein B0H14DRAFT_2631080 [Mycena olivaceomarginata]|nr:hypothetical protein B0H14DRAFT_2631080 [Mycena olivaceomarginata]
MALQNALDKWFLENITTSSLVLPDQPTCFEEALCIVDMTVLQGGNNGVFKDPHIYLLSLHIYAPKCGLSPFIRLGSFVGSKDNDDVPPWTSILKPGQTHYFLETTAFVATVICGIPDIKVYKFGLNLTTAITLCLTWFRLSTYSHASGMGTDIITKHISMCCGITGTMWSDEANIVGGGRQAAGIDGRIAVRYYPIN